MTYELILTPTRHLFLQENLDTANDGQTLNPWMQKIASAFSTSQAAGLFALAATEPKIAIPPALSYWRDFTQTYLAALCRTPEAPDGQLDPIEEPDHSELAELVLSAPPMKGGEYLSTEVLQNIWLNLDEWVREEISHSKNGLDEWLQIHAKIWQQVGRVCFHLAENKRDPEFPFAFLATYAPQLSSSGKVQYQPLGKALQEYAGEKNRKALVKLLSPVQNAAEKAVFVKELVDSGDIFHPLAWTPREAYELLQNSHLLEESGLLVRLPNWWKKRSRPRVSVTIGCSKSSLFGAKDILDFKVDLAMGDHNLSKEEWQEVMASEGGLAFIKGQWIEVDQEKLSEALDHWKKVEAEAAEGGITFIEGMRLLAGASADLSAGGDSDEVEKEWSHINAGEWLSRILADLRDPAGLDSGSAPKTFRGTLRPYQEIGCNWLKLLSGLGLGACLADDMGLGKTVQILSFLLALKQTPSTQEKKPSLLVLPASLLANWKAEIEKFAPSLKTVFVHPSETSKTALGAMAESFANGKTNPDIVLTTYGMLLRQKWLLDLEWNVVILDEAQAIKNPGSLQTKAVKQLKANSRIALTGTPVENKLSDLWSLFDFLCPGLLGSTTKFRTFVKSLEARESNQFAPLRNLVSPYILRRMKTDKSIISDLPDKTEVKAFCGLAKKQGALYAKSVNELRSALEDDEVDGMKRRGLVLAYLMRFKQICNHPSQFLGDGVYQLRDSGKFAKLITLCEEIASRQEKVLVFTQFREIIDPLAAILADVFDREGLILHGGTAVKKRQSLVESFQSENGPPFFILSLKAGGTGLNLTAASHVIHFDRWWNPAVENQATDRAFRIGQKRNVIVHKFICQGTMEEKIDKLLEDKANLADDILKQGAESMLTEMSNEELLQAVTLNVDQAAI